VINLIKRKVKSGVYEILYSSYHHQWFTVAKKDRNLYIVHNLTPLNAITVCNLQEPSLIYLYAEQCTARLIYLRLDLFVGYDHYTLAEKSRDHTTFNTLLDIMYLMVLSQDWTGSVSIFYNNVIFILQHETNRALNFLDDITLLGLKTQYKGKNGTYEVLLVNLGCHKLHSVISPPNLRRFPQSQNQLKALKKTFQSMPVTSQGNQ